MSLIRAKQYLKNVISKTEIIPFTRYKYGVGRKAQSKNQKTPSGRWPKKSAQLISKILLNAESNAKNKGLDINSLYIKKVQVNQAMKGQRRTFRAHGRVNAFLNHPCHVEIVLTEITKKIPKTFSK
jgi:large subunit ribosomal protein L17e